MTLSLTSMYAYAPINNLATSAGRSVWLYAMAFTAQDAEALSNGNGLVVTSGMSSDDIQEIDYERNAIAHTETSAQLSYSLSSPVGWFLGNMKDIPIEDLKPGADPDAYKDQYNNEIGREIANYVYDHGYRGDDANAAIDNMVMDAYNNGQLIVDLDDSRIFTTAPSWSGPSEDWASASEGRDYTGTTSLEGGIIVVGTLAEGAFNSLPDWISSKVKAAWNLAMVTGSPLVLDVSTGGTGISLTSASGSDAAYWDFGDGARHLSGWIGSGTGLLCVDPTGTGVITQADLFGNQPATGIANGFQALAAYDSNSDGVINSSDTNFGSLRVWLDSNGDGVSQSSELHTLASLGITSIDLDYTATNYEINGNTILQQSTFTMDGDTRTIADAWFTYDPTASVYDGANYSVDLNTLTLPDQLGYGLLPSFHTAMSLDSTLLGLVEDLASQSLSQLSDPSYHLESKLQAILFQWAGVESVDPDSSYAYFNSHIDAQKLAFLEQLMGQSFQGDGAIGDVGPSNMTYLGEAWNGAFSYLAAHIVGQAGFNGLMGNPVYDLTSDSLSIGGTSYDFAVQFADQALGGFELPHMATNDIFMMFAGDSPVTGPYDSPTIFIEETPSSGGTNSLLLAVAPSGVVLSDDYSGNLYVHYTSTDTVEILGDVAYSGGYHAGTIVGEYVQQIAFEDGTLWSLTGGLDLTATSTYTAVFGTAMGGDTLDGSGISGADLWGYTGNETYILGPATTVVAGNGTNTYVVNADSCPASSGGASITPNASATGDQIVLHGVTEGQVFLTDNSYGDLIVSTSNDDLVTVHGGSYAYGTGVTLGNIAGITLDDSTVLDLTGIVPLTPTSSGTLLGISTGTDFVANGYENNFDGFNSNDVFSFTAGSAPASSYGVNVSEYASGGTSTIAFHGLTPSEVVMTDDSSGDLIFQFGTDLVTVGGGSNTGSGITVGNVQQVTFDDSTVWNLQTGLHLTATGDYQYLYGTAGGGDTLTAAGTSDSLFAYTGAEALVAGALSSLHNGTGNDTDVFSTGFGYATVYANASGGSSNAIEFHSVTASDLVLSDDIYGQLTIQDTSTSDQILVSGGSYDSSTGFSVGNIQQIALDGSTDISLTGSLNLTATGNYQYLYGTGHGDNMTALGTGDNLYGIAGNNTMTGSSDSSATTNFHGGSGNDLMIGGTGTNNMYMGTGDDEIKVEGSTSTTTVTSFDTAHDTIHLEDVMSGFDALSDVLSNWVQKTESSGNTVIAVDPTGTGSFTAGPQVTLNSITGLDDIATLVAHGVVHV